MAVEPGVFRILVPSVSELVFDEPGSPSVDGPGGDVEFLGQAVVEEEACPGLECA